ncbi:hypothetical protein O7627_36015 [Solwaraspora sp. WMMD1047]|uniref:hypothetical protein n=1 Tax=Solwaraspora sp. WMMD1047 TaxID=3016102 RepID=UPI0024179421|nr:hypothetical protein [Solwaraspora sp. WMMD1047]MDG4834677.1 hypothetical protein [Solwaraspora sp. WMMD1047]
MTTPTTDDLWRLLRQASDMPYGSGQIAAMEQLLRQADALGDGELAFTARMQATTSYVYGGEPAKSFVTFSWCLADYDRDPRPYHQRQARYLLWHFKYMINAMLNFPEIPLDRTYAVLDDMERRYREGGHSLQAVHKCRHRVARHLGHDDDAEQWYRRWTTTPRDELSDCAGCDPSSQALYLAARGRDEEAIGVAEPVLSGRLSCTEQPHGILSSLLLPYLRTGRRDAARDAHRRAYRAVRGNLADLWDIGDHVEFCALTDNDARGLEIIERHLDWLDRAPSPAAAMSFAAAAALVLRRLEAAGHGDLTVHRRAAGDRAAADVPVAELRAELAAHATDLASRFDARNGTTSQSEWVAARMARDPIGPHLPLSASARRTGPAGTATGQPATAPTAASAGVGQASDPAGQPAALALAAGTAGVDTDSGATGSAAGGGQPGATGPADPGPALAPPPPPIEVPPGATAARLLDLAEECWRTERYDDLLVVLRTFDERVGAASAEARAGSAEDGAPAGQDGAPAGEDGVLPPALAARRAEFRATERHMAGDLPGAQAANREAAELYRQVPDPVRERVVIGRLGVLLCLAGEPGEGLPMVEEAADYLADRGEPVDQAGGHDRLAVALVELERWADALAAVDRAAEVAATLDDPYLIARIALRRAHCLDGLDRRPEAAAAAEQARDIYGGLGLAGHYAAACLAYARSQEEPAAAVAAYDDAVRVATGEAALPARAGRARALLATDRAPEAIDDFVEAVALCAERGIAHGAAFLRWELANAYRRADRLLDAAEVAEEAVTELDKLGHQGDADRCRHLLATIYVGLGEDDQALLVLDRLADNLDGPDNLAGRGQVLEEAGDLLYSQDRDALAALRFAAAASAYQLAGSPLDELRVRRREVAARHWAGETEEALAALTRADERAAGLPPELADDPAAAWERAMLADTGARALVGLDRHDQALERLRGVPDRLREIQAFGEAIQVDLLLGEVLLRLDRPGEAEPLLRTALGGLPAGSSVVQRAAWLLSQALAALGRTEEAEALRAEYRLDAEE